MNKKLVMASSFCLGAIMLVTTAFADIASKSGYEQLKDSIKKTTKSASNELNNFTVGIATSIKLNDKVIITDNESKKFDKAKKMEESNSTKEYANGKVNKYYYYNDSRQSIYYYNDLDTYNVVEYNEERNLGSMTDPFEDDIFEDVEMIFDAVVGNLKDYVVMEEMPDGSKEFSGSLTEVQIPAIVNAVSSFMFKKQFSGMAFNDIETGSKLPNIVSDVSVKDIRGKATVDKNGIMEKISGTVTITGKDKDGTKHEIVFELSGGISDIGKTVINTPDLTGKKVKKDIGISYSKKTVPAKYAGTYKNNIVLDNNDSFKKIGERTIVISHIDDKHVSGRYYEEIYPEFSQLKKDKLEITFDAEITGPYQAEFTYKNSEGVSEKGHLNFDSRGIVYLNITTNKASESFDPQFIRVFDK